MADFTPIDPVLAAAISAQAEQQEQQRVITGRRSKAVVVEPRTFEVWFKLPSHFGDCSNPDCADPRDTKPGCNMVAGVNGSDLCRYCFLANVNPTLT